MLCRSYFGITTRDALCTSMTSVTCTSEPPGTEAFYRILREAPMGGDLTDELVAHVLKRMKLPEDSMHRLHALLQEPCALTQAGFPDFARNAIQSIHTSTHFWVQGQSDVCRTTMGSRPGDPFADWIFSFAWACILKEVERYMVDTGITTPLQGHHMLPLFGRQDLAEQSQAFIGPNWMDDLALCISSSTCQELVSDMSRLTGFLIDLCEQHCMTPNLQQGKTEIQLSFRGAGCRTFKRQYYGPSAPRSLRILCEHGAREVQLVSQYRHLGGISHHCGDLAAEIRRRTGLAHGALNQHRKILFRTPTSPLTRGVTSSRCWSCQSSCMERIHGLPPMIAHKNVFIVPSSSSTADCFESRLSNTSLTMKFSAELDSLVLKSYYARHV